MKTKHIKDCHLGDNWKECPACIEQHEATATIPSQPQSLLSLPWRVVRPWATCSSIHDADKKCIMFGCLESEPVHREIVRAVNHHAALLAALQKAQVALVAVPVRPLPEEFMQELNKTLIAPAIEAARAALSAAQANEREGL